MWTPPSARPTGWPRRALAIMVTPASGAHPLLAVAAGTGDVLMARLREGRANTARGAAHFLRETVGRLVYCSLTNHSDETSFPFLVYLVIIRDKHFVSLRSGHHLHPVAFRGRSGLPPRRFLPADDCSYASRFGAPPGLFGTQQHASQGRRALQSTSENATSW